MATTETQQESMMMAKPHKEHQWLDKFCGDWTYEGEASMGPDTPVQMFRGTESARSLGGLWYVLEGEGDMPGYPSAKTMLTIGYDPRKKKYVGTWIGSMSAQLWVYEGSVDESGKILTLSAEGPDMSGAGKTAKYKDVTEFVSDCHRVLTSHMLGEDGQWHQFMKSHYRRK